MNTTRIISFLCILFFLGEISAQIKGNGIMETRIRSLSLFTELEVDFPAHVTVNCKELAKLEITADENVFKGIEIKHEGGKLRILQKEWIQPTKNVKITIGAPFLHKLTTSGYGEFFINNLDGPLFSVNNPVGKVHLAGKVEKLEVNMRTGTLEALQLHSKKAEVNIEGYGEAKIHAIEHLKARVGDNKEDKWLDKGTNIRLIKDDAESWITYGSWEEKKLDAPKRIDLKLKNNSGAKADFFVEGPRGNSFSYGFPIKAGASRKENFPIGSRIYLDKLLGRKLIHTVTASDANQTVSLFK